jgi:hypothetical protein
MNNDSSWAGHHDTALDRAIDRAVRDMMQVDPPPGLRRRVLSRLAGTPARRSFVSAPYAWAAAALMILVVGMSVARNRTIEPAATKVATSQPVPTSAPDRPAPQVQAPVRPLPSPPVPNRGTKSPRVTNEAIRMPRVRNVFGPRSPAVTATDASTRSRRVSARTADALVPIPALLIEPLAPMMLGASQAIDPAVTFANIRIELTIIDQRADAPAAAAKTLTLLVEDRKSGRIRTGRGNATLNVDASPEIVREGKIRVMLSLEYNPQDSPDRAAPMPIQESVTAVLDDGKPLVVSQSADPSSDRRVRLELKASIVR